MASGEMGPFVHIVQAVTKAPDPFQCELTNRALGPLASSAFKGILHFFFLAYFTTPQELNS